MAFWRRSKGRHALGAAVTSIPAAPRQAVLPPMPPLAATTLPATPLPPAAPLPAAAPPPPAAPLPAAAPAALDWSFPELAAPPAEAVAPGPRVELTFADGSSASLDPDQARALDEIAQVLTRRDEVKH